LVEHRSPKPVVVGSSPPWPAKERKLYMDKFTRNAFSLTLFAIAVVFGYTTKVAMDRVMSYMDIYVRSTALQVAISIFPILVGAASAYITYRIEKVKNYILEVIAEVKKVVWPNKKETWGATVVVIIAVIISGIVLGIFDWMAGLLLSVFFR
jgi:preprotein translocase subunit SecE